MPTRAVIFLGPTLVPRPADTPDLHYWPPARRGDLERAANSGARVIGLIDGVFGQTLAVTPAEVREVAQRGIQLVGGASMGALRACECSRAMQGVGEIWRRFVRGELTDDDEVAVTFLPDTYQLVAYPLIQVREVARLAAERYPNAVTELQQFIGTVRRLPFVKRTVERIREAAAPLLNAGLPWSQLHEWLTAPEFDLKRRDAVQVIQAVTASLVRTPCHP
jgi:TfuA protein